MNKIKIFKSSSRDVLKMEDIINSWAESENNLITQVDSFTGESYSSFGSRVEDKEVIFIVLYSKIKPKKDNKKMS
jgi:hypothetical protein